MKNALRTLGLLAVLLFGFAPRAEATVQVCPGGTPGPDCYTFDGPPCAEWSLASGTTCTDIYAQIITLDTYFGANGGVAVEYHEGGSIVGVVLDPRGQPVRSVRLLHLRSSPGGVAAGISARVVRETITLPFASKERVFDPVRTVLHISTVCVEVRTGAPLDRFAWSADVTNPRALAAPATPVQLPSCSRGPALQQEPAPRPRLRPRRPVQDR